jgi:hypothetical protein
MRLKGVPQRRSGGEGPGSVRARWKREGEGEGGLMSPLDLETVEGDGALTHGPRGIVTGGGVFHSNSNFKRIRNIFKFFQTLTASKRTFLSYKI